MAWPRARRYHSYLVRCWHGPDEGEARYVVEAVSDAPQHWGFRTLDDLLAFLCAELGDKPHEPDQESDAAEL